MRNTPQPWRKLRTLALVAALTLWLPMLARAQMTPEQQAELLLNSARKAFNERNHDFAAGRFREFLARFGGHKQAAAARYGLALALLEGGPKHYAEARDLLQSLAGAKDLPERPSALYHLGLALRGLGVHELALGEAKPPEAP